MTLNVVVYSRGETCQQCTATTRRMDRHGVAYREEALDEHPNVVAYAKEQGWTSAPVVMVFDVTGQLVAAWSGFRPDKIKEVANAG